MAILCKFRFVSVLSIGLSVIVFSSYPPVRAGDLDLSVWFTHDITSVDCNRDKCYQLEITAVVNWTHQTYTTICGETRDYFERLHFNADGQHACWFDGDDRGGRTRLMKTVLLPWSSCEGRWINYINTRHTFELVAYPIRSGDAILTDSFTYLPPDVLSVDNRVEGWHESQFGRCEIAHMQNATEALDAEDVLVSSEFAPTVARVVSVIPSEADTTETVVVDARPKESTSDVYLQLSLLTQSGEPTTFASPTKNELRFDLATMRWGNTFGYTPIRIQQYDPLIPDLASPIYDVRRLINKNGGAMRLPDLYGSYPSGEPYAYLKLSFSDANCLQADLNRDGRYDLRDFSILAGQWRRAGVLSSADLASPQDMWVPDGVVDWHDLQTLCQTSTGVIRDGFETGQLDRLNWQVNKSWKRAWEVTQSECHSGRYSAKAGDDTSHDTSLSVTLLCRVGHVRFWRKVSSEASCDWLEFYIDGQRQGRWSGELDWEPMSFPVSAGRRTFTWTYTTDTSVKVGQDTAWIDDIIFPVSPVE